MVQCHEYRPLLEKLAAGEASTAEQVQLSDHALACTACGELLRLHRELVREAEEQGEPPIEDLARIRAVVLRSIRNSSLKARRRPWLDWSSADRWVPPLLRWGLVPSMLVCGFAAGLFWSARPEKASDLILRQIASVARDNTSLSDVENSPFMYSNVSLSGLDEGKVALSFDVTTHLELEAGRDEPLVKEVLIQSLLNPSPVGMRLKAMTFARQMHDPEVRQALLLSMLYDPSVAVRLKAQSILSSFGADPEIQSAFLQVLKKEDSVQMRLEALDWLVQNKVSRDAVRDIVPQLRSEQDSAVLRKAVAYVQGR
jgi:hypothetical protein